MVARMVLAPPKLSTPLAALHPEAGAVFKDIYLEFLDLTPAPSEAALPALEEPGPLPTQPKKLSKGKKP